jgi:hypothetical protein
LDNELKSIEKDSSQEGLNVSPINDMKQVTRFEVDQSNKGFRDDSGMITAIEGLMTVEMVDAIEGFLGLTSL